jgi:hypothetical protein
VGLWVWRCGFVGSWVCPNRQTEGPPDRRQAAGPQDCQTAAKPLDRRTAKPHDRQTAGLLVALQQKLVARGAHLCRAPQPSTQPLGPAVCRLLANCKLPSDKQRAWAPAWVPQHRHSCVAPPCLRASWLTPPSRFTQSFARKLAEQPSRFAARGARREACVARPLPLPPAH